MSPTTSTARGFHSMWVDSRQHRHSWFIQYSQPLRSRKRAVAAVGSARVREPGVDLGDRLLVPGAEIDDAGARLLGERACAARVTLPACARDQEMDLGPRPSAPRHPMVRALHCGLRVTIRPHNQEEIPMRAITLLTAVLFSIGGCVTSPGSAADDSLATDEEQVAPPDTSPMEIDRAPTTAVPNAGGGFLSCTADTACSSNQEDFFGGSFISKAQAISLSLHACLAGCPGGTCTLISSGCTPR